MNFYRITLFLSTITLCYSIEAAIKKTAPKKFYPTTTKRTQAPTKKAAPKKSFKPTESKNYEKIDAAEQFYAIKNQSGVNVINFSTEWCGACKMMEPKFNKAAAQQKGKAGFWHIDADNSEMKDILKEQNIEAVPTTIVTKNGRVLKSDPGVLDESELAGRVDNAIGVPAKTTRTLYKPAKAR